MLAAQGRRPPRVARSLGGDIEQRVGDTRQGGDHHDDRCRATRPRTCGPACYAASQPLTRRVTAKVSALTLCSSHARTIASPTAAARGGVVTATTVGPDPLSVAPYEPAARADAVTASKPVTRARR